MERLLYPPWQIIHKCVVKKFAFYQSYGNDPAAVWIFEKFNVA